MLVIIIVVVCVFVFALLLVIVVLGLARAVLFVHILAAVFIVLAVLIVRVTPITLMVVVGFDSWFSFHEWQVLMVLPMDSDFPIMSVTVRLVKRTT